ncbi:hypothetical protein TNCV_4921801 [Trichonephila clavipes]|nr:hypothetical protein TNCV_4921801 [Trichonephila clavipes]
MCLPFRPTKVKPLSFSLVPGARRRAAWRNHRLDWFFRNLIRARQYFSPALPTGHAPPHNLNLSPRGSQSESMFTVPNIQSESNLLALSQAKKTQNTFHPDEEP